MVLCKSLASFFIHGCFLIDCRKLELMYDCVTLEKLYKKWWSPMKWNWMEEHTKVLSNNMSWELFPTQRESSSSSFCVPLRQQKSKDWIQQLKNIHLVNQAGTTHAWECIIHVTHNTLFVSCLTPPLWSHLSYPPSISESSPGTANSVCLFNN